MRNTSTLAALALLAVLAVPSLSGAFSTGQAKSSVLVLPAPVVAPGCIVYENSADVVVTNDVTTVLAADPDVCGALIQNIGQVGAARCRFLTDAVPTSTAGIELQAGQTMELGREAAAGLRCTRVATDNQTISPTYKYYEVLP